VIVVAVVVGLLGSAPPECDRAQHVTEPCDGLLVPLDEARAAIRCVRVDLPECTEQAANREARLAAELEAARKLADVQRARGDQLAALLQEATAPPPAVTDTWRVVAVVVGLTLAVVGGVTAGLEVDRPEAAVPLAVVGAGGLGVAVVGLVDP
jgi:hypothetical protein